MIEVGTRVEVLRVNPLWYHDDSEWAAYHNKHGVVISIRLDGMYADQPYRVRFDNQDCLWCHEVSEVIVLPKELFEI